ncbi:MAG TPA: DUF4167 domain-containing protein [Sphingomicrobium sp.]|nr:DUF4167 domain-containing protein [Sphingomicrobium sp.]
MINNRQGGRRRGRGGQRPQNLGGRPDGNRQDNRQRGNAAQLLEKYKSMARDAQLGGDRVQTEYYLQYADHYYRVLGESRARFEEQRQARGDGNEDDGDDEQMDSSDERSADDHRDDDRHEPRESRDRPEPKESRERFERPERNARPDRPDRSERPERPDRNVRNERPQRSPRYARPEGNGEDVPDAVDGEPRGGGLESIAFDALPPAIGRADPVEPADEVKAPAPKRRARKPRPADDEGEVAPAA